ncbi:hypothetical protein P692DRAFT_20907761 [Suillus brevipes Sb2]|nr:hypothetical protein P692DRAFT_20907761 [Suillus brevipes Sb2]
MSLTLTFGFAPCFYCAVATGNFYATRKSVPTTDFPDLNNVQGDAIYLFPKVNNRFKQLSFKPTTAEDVKDNLTSIAVAKANASDPSNVPIVDISQYQIAFSHAGMYFLGMNEDAGDARFDKRCRVTTSSSLATNDIGTLYLSRRILTQ